MFWPPLMWSIWRFILMHRILPVLFHFYPPPMRAVGYCHGRHRLSLCLCARPSSPHYHSAAHDIYRILFIIGTAIDLSGSMNAFDYRASVFIFVDPVALWNFMNTMTDLLLELGRLRVSVQRTAKKLSGVILDSPCSSIHPSVSGR